jgi:hypothetical protein
MLFKPKINFVSNDNVLSWQNLAGKRNKNFSYIFSNQPVEADFHIVYNLTTKMLIPNNRDNIAFVVTEPPEIEEYKIKFLRQFGVIFAPEFEYLKVLNNVKFLGGLLAWQAGFSFYDKKIQVVTPFSKIENSWNEYRPIKLSVITSSKCYTPHQKQRLKFIEFLSHKIDGIEIFGRGFSEIKDKAEILLQSRYHLAAENSIHNGYWTEKFIDPLICGSQIFYAGDNSLSNIFKSFIGINLNSFEDSKYIIEKSMQEDLWTKNFTVRGSDYKKYLEEYNLLQYIESWVNQTGINAKKSTIKITAQNPKAKEYYIKVDNLIKHKLGKNLSF